MNRIACCVLVGLSAGCAQAPAPAGGAAPDAEEPPLAPAVAHHQHLLSPMVAELSSSTPLPAVELPAELAALIRERARGWNDTAILAPLLAENVMLLDDRGNGWLRGRREVASLLSQNFARPHTITPVSYGLNGGAAHVEGYFSRPVDGGVRHFGYVQLSLVKEADGAWRIAAETPAFPGPGTTAPVPADSLVAQMDEAGVRRGVILSLGYTWGSATRAPVPDELARVRAENDWTAREAARFPDRLVAFCGVNPLKDYALGEIERCAREAGMRGLKLHFGNSGVDVRNPEHVGRVRAVFRAANALRLPIVAHLWTRDPEYGSEHSVIFLEQILPEAPDVVVQVAHMSGAGPGYGPDAAMEPLAAAVAAGDPRTRNLYFDVTTNVTTNISAADAALVARRIRQIGTDRILFGSDGGWGGNPSMRQAWGAFRGMLPLTEAELRAIAANVAPYMR